MIETTPSPESDPAGCTYLSSRLGQSSALDVLAGLDIQGPCAGPPSTGADVRELEIHAEACPHCASWLEGERRLNTALASWDSPAPPPSLADQIDSRIDESVEADLAAVNADPAFDNWAVSVPKSLTNGAFIRSLLERLEAQLDDEVDDPRLEEALDKWLAPAPPSSLTEGILRTLAPSDSEAPVQKRQVSRGTSPGGGSPRILRSPGQDPRFLRRQFVPVRGLATAAAVVIALTLGALLDSNVHSPDGNETPKLSSPTHHRSDKVASVVSPRSLEPVPVDLLATSEPRDALIAYPAPRPSRRGSTFLKAALAVTADFGPR